MRRLRGRGPVNRLKQCGFCQAHLSFSGNFSYLSKTRLPGKALGSFSFLQPSTTTTTRPVDWRKTMLSLQSWVQTEKSPNGVKTLHNSHTSMPPGSLLTDFYYHHHGDSWPQLISVLFYKSIQGAWVKLPGWALLPI